MSEQKTALVLSGGGMFGAYQAGAYRAIAELAPPDIVVGVSAGALNGWPIAGGCTPDHLVERWLDPSAGEALKRFAKPGWHNGWFDPAALRARAEEIRSRYEPKLPFGLVVIQFPQLSQHLVTHPYVTAAHLQASCSIPLLLASVKIDGRRYLDGGLFERLPIWAALEMGATRIIAVDSLPNAGKSWLGLGIGVAHAFKRKRRFSPDLDLTIIRSSEVLGGANDSVFWKRENAERWVDMGARDAVRVLAGVRTAVTNVP